MTTVIAQALQKLWWKSWEGTPEEERKPWSDRLGKQK